MSVIYLVKYINKETISVLKVLLTMAVKGELRGLALCYRTAEGAEKTVFTGHYKDNPANALNGAMRLSMAMNQFQDSALL